MWESAAMSWWRGVGKWDSGASEKARKAVVVGLEVVQGMCGARERGREIWGWAMGVM
jgi:hypothetical protein